MDVRFVKCSVCGNIVAFVKDSGVRPVCCDKPMQDLVPNTTDAAQEKHVPILKRVGATVTVEVGSTPHPMTAEHSIEWILLQTRQGNQRKALNPGDAPSASFALSPGDAPMAAYANCNLHGLWKADASASAEA